MNKYNTKEFVEKAKQIHCNKYDYSKTEYNGAHIKVCIICPEHGEFWQTPANHLHKQGCPKCSAINGHNLQKNGKNKFIEIAKKVHGDKYDYSKVEYVNNKTKVCIICPEHGEFWQRPDKHCSSKRGCPECGGTKKLTLEKFIEQSNKKHCNVYNYSKVEYINTETKVCIICPEHGEFWQSPHAHLSGEGCPTCKKSCLEKEIKIFLDNNGIKYEEEKKFEWLGLLRLDFYLPDYNIAIECQGIQHFKPVEFFGGVKRFKDQIKKDSQKKELCEKHNIRILYYTKLNNNCFTSLDELKVALYEDKNRQ